MTAAPIDQSRYRQLTKFFLAGAVFVVAAAFAFGDLLWSSNRVLSETGTDLWRQNYAWEQFGFGELARGHLTLWNPYIFCGAPFFAGFQSALLYPPNWLHLVVSMPLVVNIEAVLHVVLAGLCMYCWAAYRRLHWLACVSAGLIFMFSGPNFGQLLAGHIPHCCVMAWTPLIFLAIDDLTMVGSIRSIFLGSAVVALQVLAGHPQYVFYTAVAAGFYLLLNLISSPVRLRAIGGFLAIYIGGALLSAVQVLAGLQATGESMRTKMGFEFTSSFSFPPENLLTMFLPNIFGNGSTVPYFGRWFYWEVSAFAGLTGVVLAQFALAVPVRKRRWTFTMLFLTLIIAMGKYTPLGEVILRSPGFDSFRGITKFMFLVLMFLAMLSGMGFDWLLRGGQVRKWVLEYLGGAALLFGTAAVTVTVSAKSEWSGWWGHMLHSDNWTFHPLSLSTDLLHQTAAAAATDLWWAAGACVAVGAIVLAGRRYPRAHWALAAVLALELIVFARGVHSSFALADLQKYVDQVAANFPESSTGIRTWTYEQGSFLMVRRLNSWGDDPMMLRRYVELMAATFGVPPVDMITHMPTNYGTFSPPQWKLSRTGWFFLDVGGGRLRQFPNTHIPLPRASLIANMLVEPDRAKLLSAMGGADFDPRDTAIIESPLALGPAGGYNLGRVEVHDIDSDTLDIDTTTNSPCLLLVTDAYSTGWHAVALPDSSQQKYDVIPADLAFRGVPLATPGHHHFQLIYRPTAFVIGEWITIAALAAYLAAMMFWLGARFFITPAEIAPAARGANGDAIIPPTQS